MQLSNNCLDEAAIEQLVLGQWPLLEELSLSDIIDKVSLSIKDLQNGNWPVLRSIELCNTNLAGHVAEFTGVFWPLLSHIGLSNNCLGHYDLKQLAANWPQLTSLDLSGNSIGVDGVRVLVHSHWSGLQRLALGRCALTDAALPTLVEGKWLQLISLDLQRNEFSCPMMDCLAKAPWPALQELNLGLKMMTRHDMMSNGLLLIFSKLEALNLSNHWLSEEALEQLGGMHWPHLKIMGLANSFGSFIDAEGAAFLDTVAWPLIESLDLSKNSMSKEAMTALSRQQFLQLKQLNLEHTNLGSDCCGLDFLRFALVVDSDGDLATDEDPDGFPFASHDCPFLESLDLSRNNAIRLHMQQLVTAPWPALKHLSLRGVDLNLHRLQILFQQAWPTLVSLELHDSNLPRVNALLFPNAQPQMRDGLNCWNTEMPWQAQGWLPQLKTLTFSNCYR